MLTPDGLPRPVLDTIFALLPPGVPGFVGGGAVRDFGLAEDVDLWIPCALPEQPSLTTRILNHIQQMGELGDPRVFRLSERYELELPWEDIKLLATRIGEA